MKKFWKVIIITISILICSLTTAYSHSGRIDSNGGHRDNANKSGLGSYHYHCGGHPPHLHDNGICPYDTKDTIVISNIPDSLKVKDKLKLDCSITSVKKYNVKWTSSDSSILMVNSNGELVANKIGGATITVTTYNNSKSFYVSVLPININSIKLAKDSMDVQLNDTNKINATILPSDATDKTLTWKSENDNIASVDSNGQIKGISVGETKIVVTSKDGVTATSIVKVYEVFPEAIKTETDNLRVEINQTPKIQYSIIPENSNNKKVIFEIEDSNIATVNENGEIRPVSLGKTNIKLITSNNIVKSIPIEIFEINADAINIKKNSSDFIIGNYIDVGRTFRLDGDFSPKDATYNDLKWTTSDEEIVSISNKNEFTANKLGTAILTASNSEGVQDNIKIIVVDKSKIIKEIELGVTSCVAITSASVFYIRRKNRKFIKSR